MQGWMRRMQGASGVGAVMPSISGRARDDTFSPPVWMMLRAGSGSAAKPQRSGVTCGAATVRRSFEPARNTRVRRTHRRRGLHGHRHGRHAYGRVGAVTALSAGAAPDQRGTGLETNGPTATQRLFPFCCAPSDRHGSKRKRSSRRACDRSVDCGQGCGCTGEIAIGVMNGGRVVAPVTLHGCWIATA